MGHVPQEPLPFLDDLQQAPAQPFDLTSQGLEISRALDPDRVGELPVAELAYRLVDVPDRPPRSKVKTKASPRLIGTSAADCQSSRVRARSVSSCSLTNSRSICRLASTDNWPPICARRAKLRSAADTSRRSSEPSPVASRGLAPQLGDQPGRAPSPGSVSRASSTVSIRRRFSPNTSRSSARPRSWYSRALRSIAAICRTIACV